MALGIACKSGGEVRVVSIVTPLPETHPTENRDPLEEERLAFAREETSTYLEELQKRVILSGCDVPLSCHVEVGPVVEALDLHVREAQADLLVMTTHGRGPLRRAWLGSVADGLLRRTPAPILALRPKEGEELALEEKEFRRILVTLDGSPESREILPLASTLAQVSGARLTLFRVIPPHYSLTSPFTSHTSHELGGLETEEKAARDALEAEASALREEGLTVDVETVTGVSPAEGILDFAEKEGVDLVAMATHGRGGVARLVLGSIADKVIRGGNVPVLLHRAG
jgi:nucleotide-binding universal stress UspA family protein